MHIIVIRLRILLVFVILNQFFAPNLYSQNLTIDLNPGSDTIVNQFYVKFHQEGSTTSDINWKLPPLTNCIFTTSRSIYLKSIDETLGVLIGENKKAEKFAIFDKNMNYDFRDDAIIYFHDTTTTFRQGNYKTVNLRLEKDKNEHFEITFDYTIVKPKGLNLEIEDSLENRIFFGYRSRNFYKTVTTIKKKRFYFYLVPKTPLDFTINSLRLIISDSAVDFKSLNKFSHLRDGYRLGDMIKLAEENYAIDKISPDGLKIALRRITDKKPMGRNLGFYVPDLSFNTVEGIDLRLSQLKTRYVLLEFWGTWCGPCKAILPGLKSLYENNKEKGLSIVSIACNDKLDLVLKHKKENQVYWPQVLNATAGNPDFSSQYDMGIFPGFLLMDSSGKIVFRDFGISGFDNLRKFIETNLK